MEPLEQSLRRRVRERFPTHFQILDDLQMMATLTMMDVQGKPHDVYDFFLYLSFARASKSCLSCKCLLEVASTEDACVLLRNLINFAAIIRWISLKPDLRPQRYIDWLCVERHRDLEKGNSYSSRDADSIRASFLKIKDQFKNGKSRRKDGLVDHWYQPEANTIRDLFTQCGMTKDYEESYVFLSSIEHSTFGTFSTMLRNSSTEMKTKIGVHSVRYIPFLIIHLHHYFGMIFRHCNDYLVLTDQKQLWQVLDSGEESLRSMEMFAED